MGFFIIFIGIVLLILAAILYGEGQINFGALIFIGPIPIVVGAGPQATLMVIFAIILAILSVIIFIILRRGIVKS